MSEDTPRDETESIHLNSDPIEVARHKTPHGARAGQPPDQIGPYKVLSELGAGGMGVVYLAEQTKPIHRRVALKLIKLGMDTRQVIARFEAEREALAQMNHPHVARVFDAGATETGRPYFVMEYVEGVPLTDYCDRNRLSTKDRLKLFMQVCHAVQHAHQKGIIHRDLKPSNVLVTKVDDAPAAKVIDFGIAKATQQRIAEVTLFTEQGQLVGTPAYMSPEQADPTTQDIDTRTDIYSLGVILYELLVGALPFDTKTLLRGGFAEIQRIIREVDPPKPSTRLSALASAIPQPEPSPSVGGHPRDESRGSDIATIAHHRRTEPKTLIRQIRGDIDWIVMKCLEKDRTRRYDTANGLALEIERYLNHEPVLAGPPSATYRMRKFVRRNRAFMASVAAIVFALSIGLTVAVGMYLRAESAREETARERDRAYEAEQATGQARDVAEQVTKFLSDMLSAADPSIQGKDVSVREVLDRASEKISQQFAGKPLIEAQLKNTVGWTYHGLGLYDRAKAHLADAAAIYRRVLGERDPRTLRATNNLSATIGALGKYSASEASLRSTLEIQRAVLGENHPDTLRSINNLGMTVSGQGRYSEAEELHRKNLEIRNRVLGEEHPETLSSMNNLANVLQEEARYSEAEELHRKTLEIRHRTLGKEHPETLNSMNNLANVLKDVGRLTEAEELFRRTLEIKRRVLGEEHRETLGTMNNLVYVLGGQGRFSEAQELCQQTLGIERRVLGEEHPLTLITMINLGEVLYGQGRYPEAQELCQRTLEIQRRVMGEEHPLTLKTMINLGRALGDQGRYAEAEEIYRKTLDIQRRVLGTEHPDTLLSMNNLAEVLGDQGRYSEAEELARQALMVWEKRGEATDPVWLTTCTRGGALTGLGRFAEAEPLLVAAHGVIKDRGDVSPADKRRALDRVIRLYESWDAAEPGKGYAEKAAEWRARYEEPSSK